MKSNGQSAIVSNQEYGPMFGNSDICIANNSDAVQTSSSYFPAYFLKPTNIDFGSRPLNTLFAGAAQFQLLEIEVFQRV